MVIEPERPVQLQRPVRSVPVAPVDPGREFVPAAAAPAPVLEQTATSRGLDELMVSPAATSGTVPNPETGDPEVDLTANSRPAGVKAAPGGGSVALATVIAVLLAVGLGGSLVYSS